MTDHDPRTGELWPDVPAARIDAQAEALDALDAEIGRLRAYRAEIAADLEAAAAEDPRRTAHVLGGAWQVKVERSAPTYDQATLRRLADGPGREWVRVERYAVAARPWAQAESASIADPELRAARDALRAAVQPPRSARVTVRRREP